MHENIVAKLLAREWDDGAQKLRSSSNRPKKSLAPAAGKQAGVIRRDAGGVRKTLVRGAVTGGIDSATEHLADRGLCMCAIRGAWLTSCSTTVRMSC